MLNAARFYEIGIPLSYAQYTQLSPTHLVPRLLARNLHLLALRISSYLALPPDAVLKHWACAKIVRSKPQASGTGKNAELDGGDDALCRVIVEKFETLGRGRAGVSYADIAKRAWEVGRTALATRLLDYETKASDQVPLLLSMQEDKLALAKAVESGDTDLGKPMCDAAREVADAQGDSVPRPSAPAEAAVIGLILQADRGWRAAFGASEQAAPGVCARTEP